MKKITFSLLLLLFSFQAIAQVVNQSANFVSDDVGDNPISAFANDSEFKVHADARVPIIITAIPQNYSASNANIVWYKDGDIIEGQNGLILPVLSAGYYEIEVTNSTTGLKGTIGKTVTELLNSHIPQGISPNNDGLNDAFDLSGFNVVKIEIFNRYGTMVYAKDGYTNEWHGQSDNGDELPVGTYYYTMIYEGGTEQISSWVYLNK